MVLDDAKKQVIAAWIKDVAVGIFSGLYDVYGDNLIRIPPRKIGAFLGGVREFREAGKAIRKLWKIFRREGEKLMSVDEILRRALDVSPEAYRLFSTPEGRRWLEECLRELREWLDSGE